MNSSVKPRMSTTKKIAIAAAIGVGIAAPVTYAVLRRRKTRAALKKTLVEKKEQALSLAEKRGGVAARAAHVVRRAESALTSVRGRKASQSARRKASAK